MAITMAMTSSSLGSRSSSSSASMGRNKKRPQRGKMVICSAAGIGTDPYRTLRIQRGASEKEVKRAFRQLALQETEGPQISPRIQPLSSSSQMDSRNEDIDVGMSPIVPYVPPTIETEASPSTKRSSKDLKPLKSAHLHFRSAIGPLVRTITSLKDNLRKEHFKAIGETPFGIFFEALVKQENEGEEMRKDNYMIMKILATYDKETNLFKIGNEFLSITPRDISVIFGIPKMVDKKGKQQSASKKRKCTGRDFVKKYFPSAAHVKPNAIIAAMKRMVNGKKEDEVKDFSVLVSTLICCCLFFPNGAGSLNKSTIEALYEDMDTTDWSKLIAENLMTCVHKYTQLADPGGCTMTLSYWLAEHVQIAKRENDSVPRFLNWNLKEINKKIEKTDLSQIDGKKISKDLILSSTEEELLEVMFDQDKVEKKISDDDDDDDDDDFVEDYRLACVKRKNRKSTIVESSDEDDDLVTSKINLKDEVGKLEMKLEKEVRERKSLKKENKKLKEQIEEFRSEAIKYRRKYEELKKKKGKEVEQKTTRKRKSKDKKTLDSVDREEEERGSKRSKKEARKQHHKLQKKRNETDAASVSVKEGAALEQIEAATTLKHLEEAAIAEHFVALPPIEEQAEEAIAAAEQQKEFEIAVEHTDAAEVAEQEDEPEIAPEQEQLAGAGALAAAEDEEEDEETISDKRDDDDEDIHKSIAEVEQSLPHIEFDKDEETIAVREEEIQIESTDRVVENVVTAIEDYYSERFEPVISEIPICLVQPQEKQITRYSDKKLYIERPNIEGSVVEKERKVSKSKKMPKTDMGVVQTKPMKVKKVPLKKEAVKKAPVKKAAEKKAVKKDEAKIKGKMVAESSKSIEEAKSEGKMITEASTKLEEKKKDEKPLPLSKFKLYKLLSAEEKIVLHNWFRNYTPGKMAWGAAGSSISVSAEILSQILNKEYVLSDIIDWYGNYLTRRIIKDKKFIILNTYCGMFILQENEEGIKEHLIKFLDDEMVSSVEYLLIPFNNMQEDHYLLLVLDLQSWEWSFYDSIQHHDLTNYPDLNDAKKIKSRVYIEVCKIAEKNGMAKDVERNVDIKNCPKQDPKGNGCAIYVMYFMEELVKRDGMHLSQCAEQPKNVQWKNMDMKRIEYVMLVFKDREEMVEEFKRLEIPPECYEI